VVLLDYDRLLSGLGSAHLDTGEAISAACARLLASEAGVIPAVYRHVLGGPSVVLTRDGDGASTTRRSASR
jgi:hypothetical protein